MKNLNKINNNIYITSDEEIKEGDWYLDTFNTQRIKANQFSDHKHYGNACKKIILTTDTELIKDGVQAINDEFLEWFVTNPSCESVEVLRCPIEGLYTIIPKEELKQECECTDECLGYLTKECERIEEPKQETLEEAAERFYGEEEIVNDYDISGYLQSAFLTGAKWQQEQLCNSEIIQRIRATKSDAEARRIIKSI
jgi:hypothetical protein